MNPATLPKGPSIESDGMFGQAKEANQPGIYRHKETGKELIVVPDPTSRAQQDALVRLGFEWVGEAPDRNGILKMQADQLKADKKNPQPEPGSYAINTDPDREVYNGTVTDPNAELAAANARIAELEAAVAPVEATPAPAEPAVETPEVAEPVIDEAPEAPAETPETKTNETKES